MGYGFAYRSLYVLSFLLIISVCGISSSCCCLLNFVLFCFVAVVVDFLKVILETDFKTNQIMIIFCMKFYFQLTYIFTFFSLYDTIVSKKCATAPQTNFVTVCAFFSKTSTDWGQVRYVSYR